MISSKLLENGSNQILISVKIRVTNPLHDRAILVMNIFSQQTTTSFVKIQSKTFQQPFPEQDLITDLKPKSTYRINLRLENGQHNHLSELVVTTLGDPNQEIMYQRNQRQNSQGRQLTQFNSIGSLQDKFVCDSEKHLLNLIEAENSDVHYFKGKGDIKQTILKARKNSSNQGFMNLENKVIRPPIQKNERFRRIWMVSKGYELYDNLYANSKEGQGFMKNDWHMGPFYSYDKNAKDLQLQRKSEKEESKSQF